MIRVQLVRKDQYGTGSEPEPAVIRRQNLSIASISGHGCITYQLCPVCLKETVSFARGSQEWHEVDDLFALSSHNTGLQIPDTGRASSCRSW